MASPANFTLAELGANAKKGHATWWSVNPELLAPLAKLLYTNTGGIGTTFVPVGEKTAILFMEAAIMDGSQAMRLEVAGELLKALEGARNVIGAAIDLWLRAHKEEVFNDAWAVQVRKAGHEMAACVFQLKETHREAVESASR